MAMRKQKSKLEWYRVYNFILYFSVWFSNDDDQYKGLPITVRFLFSGGRVRMGKEVKLAEKNTLSYSFYLTKIQQKQTSKKPN